MPGVTLSAMTTQANNAQRSVVAAAQDLRDIARVASPPDVLDLLDEVARALGELASACEEAGPALVPRPRGAASDWRVRRAGDASADRLSHQEKRLALSTLHDQPALLGLALRLRDRGVVAPQAAAMASHLVGSGDSPLYANAVNASLVNYALRASAVIDEAREPELR